MKIKVKCDKFNYGGNSFKKGDVLEIDGVHLQSVLAKNDVIVFDEEVKSIVKTEEFKAEIKDKPKSIIKKIFKK